MSVNLFKTETSYRGAGEGVIATTANPPLLPKGLKCFHVLGLTCYFLLLLFIFFISRK